MAPSLEQVQPETALADASGLRGSHAGHSPQAVGRPHDDGKKVFGHVGPEAESCTDSEVPGAAWSDAAAPKDEAPSFVKRWLPLAVVVLIAATQVSASQLTRTVQQGFSAPFFVMWVHTSLMTSCLPVARFFAPRGVRVTAKAVDIAFFLVLWVVANYCFTYALKCAPAGIVQTLFGTAPAAVAILSRWILSEPLTMRRIAAAVLALAGASAVGIGAQKSGDASSGGRTLLGIGLALGAVAAAACYKVGFKRRFGEPPGWMVLGFSGSLGAVMGVVGTIPALILAWEGVEAKWWSSSVSVPWGLLFLAGSIQVVYNTAIAFGLSISSPIFIALGTILSIPVSLSVDVLFRGQSINLPEVLGAVTIIVSFALLLMQPPAREHQPTLPFREPSTPQD